MSDVSKTKTQAHDTILKFVEEALTSEKIYMIMGPDGAAGSFSNDYFDEEQHNYPLIPFWTDEAMDQANMAVSENGSEFQIIYVPLSEFVTSWLPGMREDEVIVGINWSADMTGPEIEPEELFLMFYERMDDNQRLMIDMQSDNSSAA